MPSLPDIRRFSRVVFFTGAGMSAESGVPTYRGQGGLWHEYRPEEYACQEAFERDPDKVWDFHDKRRATTGACAPHEGHELLARFEERFAETVVVTQNIDGMHQLAGSRTVHELHGSLWRLRCERCGVSEESRAAPLVPRTHACGAYWRPGIVWFGDYLPASTVEAATKAISGCDLLVSVGTSAVVYPAAQLPLLAEAAGATLVEINPEETPLSPVYTHHVRLPASAALRALLEPALR